MSKKVSKAGKGKRRYTEVEDQEVSYPSKKAITAITRKDAQEELKSTTSIQDSLHCYGYARSLQIEHAVTKLVESYQKIIELSPNLKIYKENIENFEKISPEICNFFMRPSLKLAAELKSLHELGKDSVFSQLSSFGETYDSKDTRPVLIGLENSDIETLSDKKLESPDDKTGSDLKAKDEDDEDSYNPEAYQIDKAGSKKKKKKWPPPLPEIENPAIKAKVFIHKSIVKDKLFLLESQMLNAHNERLEWLGDSILNTTISTIIYNKFPNYSEGKLSKLRIMLINNENLREWTYLYGLEKGIKAAKSGEQKNGSLSAKAYADVFEAYIGGLMEDDAQKNLPKIRKWLAKLSKPLIEKVSKTDIELENTDNLNPNAKKELYSLIGYAALKLQYVATKMPSQSQPYSVVECRIGDGTVLGVGVGRNVKLAGIKAAMSVLDNSELIEKYSQLRAAIPRSESSIKDSGEKSKAKISLNENGELFFS
ncbi:hypothetical protein TBLA_0B02870 [Henningerozyma blattae CBS 6284]|uniref:ribonuclease III n=1 Tax=Henningerozyma blattae (strain ATCC 34711 / CBS 6284 / DSM 70876 / NBRC 10599 / NRRL Y-10934 / UCD 77-7) TaxID=1071380 RepID=I2GYC7_HENB6|nr:hypothetical protein TBLA_0B02870 [Tetrapisispora blattae CBS 6284]CCH59129.1 hypothetical protein TBLA_0B02870 [Tetrapisispora blattae CBS 6284]